MLNHSVPAPGPDFKLSYQRLKKILILNRAVKDPSFFTIMEKAPTIEIVCSTNFEPCYLYLDSHGYGHRHRLGPGQDILLQCRGEKVGLSIVICIQTTLSILRHNQLTIYRY